MKKYTKEQFLLAAKLGEVNMIDAEHIVSLLDEAVALESGEKCRCIRIVGSTEWFTNGCKIHTRGNNG